MTKAQIQDRLRQLDEAIKVLETSEAEYRDEWEACDDPDTQRDIMRSLKPIADELDLLRGERAALELAHSKIGA
jgi:hypothetical protein